MAPHPTSFSESLTTLNQHDRAWLRALPLPSIVVDTTGRITDANGLAVDLFGLDDHHGRHVGALIQTDDISSLLTQIDLLQQAPETIGVRDVAVKTGGDLRQYRLHLKGVPDGFDTPAVLVQFQDLSDIAARETELLRTLSRWNLALSNAKTGIWEFDLHSNASVYADSWKKLRGLDPAETLPITLPEVLEAIHPDDIDRVLDMVMRQRDGDESCNVYDYRMRKPDGSWIWIECRSSTVEWGPDGKPARIIGTDIDITERKHAEETLERLSRRLSVALEASGIGVFEANLTTGEVEWDKGQFRVFGVPETHDVKIGETWERILHPEDRERVLSRVDHDLALLQPNNDEYRIVLSNGEVRHICCHALPFLDSNGHRRMIGANWDVTDDRRLRKAIEEAHSLTEARNRELEAAKAAIERVALLDPLTNLPNRRSLDNELARIAAMPDLAQIGMSVLHIDLDRFKQINDTHGHHVGDLVLTHAATILRENTRSADLSARVGGDEFVLLAPGLTNLDALSSLAGRIIEAMRKPVLIDTIECCLGCSIGIAIGHRTAFDPRHLLLNADIALYKAKNQGRDRFEFFIDDPHAPIPQDQPDPAQ